MKNLICPISVEKVDENVVRLTALWVIVLVGLFLIYQTPYIPLYLMVDFYIRAFTKLPSSPLSWISKKLVKQFELQPQKIDKAPKVFAARVGLLFSILIFGFSFVGFPVAATVLATVLILFALLECVLNFCAGCWVYTYMVLPFYRDR